MKFSLHSIALTLGLFLASGSLTTTASAKDTKPEDRASVTDFALKNLKGKMVKLSDQKGKVVVVTFWATWCAPCIQELPHLNRFYKDLKGKGLTVLAINIDGPDTFSKAKTIIKRKRLKLPILLDPEGEVTAILNPRGTNPYTLFIDRHGRLAADHEGFAKGDEVKALAKITKLLAEPGPS
jgi:peroxiredoxin